MGSSWDRSSPISSALAPLWSTLVEAMKIMVTSLKRCHAWTAALSAPNPAAGHHPPTPPPETPGHPQASPGQSLLGSLLLSPGCWCTGFSCALPESISQGCVSSGSPMVGLMAPSSKRAYAIAKSAAPRARPCGRPPPSGTSTGDSQTQFCLGLCGVLGSWCPQGLSEPSELLWRERGLILNVDSPLLPSCWGFSFVLGRGVSPHSHSSAYWGFSDFGRGGISTRQVQRSAAATPDLGCGVVAPGMSRQFISGMSE